MAHSRIYKLTSTGTGDAVANLIIGQSGIITAMFWDCAGLGPAGVNGGESFEVAQNNASSSFTTNDPAGWSLTSCSIATSVASSQCTSQKSVQGVAIPVRAGDRLYLHQATTSGAGAMAARRATCHIAVS